MRGMLILRRLRGDNDVCRVLVGCIGSFAVGLLRLLSSCPFDYPFLIEA